VDHRRWNTPERLQELLCTLVGWRSVTGSDGEARFAGLLADEIRSSPSLSERPDAVALGPIDHGRAYVTALHRAPGVQDTVVLISHFDTVDTQDFGVHEPHAFDPVALTAAYAADPSSLDADAAADAASDEWLFGRGAMDMKAGLALHMALLEQAAHEQWPINLVLLAVPDEEVNSTGMRAAVDGLRDLARAHDLEYVLFLNGEPSFPARPGDDTRYLYTGSIGKIMPSVLCFGRETHAGTPMSGLTSSFIASYVTQAMEFSDAFRETVHGETTPVPVTLDQHDRRDGYSTQTPFRTSALYNVFVMEQTADDVMDRFERVVGAAAERCMRDYRAACERDGVAPIGELRVLRYADLHAHALGALGQATLDERCAAAIADGDDDLREQSLRIVDSLLSACPELTPAIVVLFAPPYYPAVNSTDDDLVRASVERVQRQSTERFGVDLARSHFFNGISDLSYVSYRGDASSSRTYERNTPGFGETYAIPFDAMAELDAPVLNVGPFGKDPHQRTERLHVRSAFVELPELLADLIRFVASR
jgi:arginine utilization protein RocB